MTECLMGFQEIVDPQTEETQLVISCPLARSGLCGYASPNNLPIRFQPVQKDNPAYPLGKRFIQNTVVPDHRRLCSGPKSPTK